MELSRRGRWTTGTRSEALFITAENEPSDMNRSLLLIMWHRNSRHSSWLSRWRPGEWNIGKFEAHHFADSRPFVMYATNTPTLLGFMLRSGCREPSKSSENL